ncbi:thiolase family protein [Endozoicomonas numazuensis]|uniref:Acetyl-CoA acetyltransferase n=1 Tax=Endozoicomonas numazuensis TaxID=1137799 RepID=A0A081N132_9GAMM|nr:thiolase family protein [Endozoicomonas numazuensis]KEQ12155.1 acetyl-CoA acetyltransferase [Endozoicomonas numazuensis]
MSDQVSIVIVSAARTPMGGFQGNLSEVPAPQLGAVAIRSAVEKSGLPASDISEVLMGCVLPAGCRQSPARQAARGAGLNDATCTTTVNKVCGSGMKTVMMGAAQLQLGEVDAVVAGGMESMTNAPYLLDKVRSGLRLGHGQVKDHMFTDGLEDAYDGHAMGVFAEQTAKRFEMSREAMDDYALESLRRAQAAIEAGSFADEIVPVETPRKGEVTIDEQPGKARPEKIRQLRPAFDKEGSVTAANSSSISDGAAALVLMREEDALAKGLSPIARIKGYQSHAQLPAEFTIAPIAAISKLLEKVDWQVDDVDLFEINEAFAVVTMACMQELGLDHNKVNVFGGACALGHPLGASGARIIVTLLNALKIKGGKKGVASLCIGGGEATAIAIELV